MRVVLRYVLTFLITVPAGFLLLYPQLLRCIRISESDEFRALPGVGSVFVRRTATSAQLTSVRRHIQTARQRIRRFWGDRRGQAVLIYCPEQADYERYCVGGEGAGCSLGLPWGDSYLVLGPDGNNPDVIAHELCHDELFARLGYWRLKRQIPQWFNEGLALMVDFRFTDPAIWERPPGSRTDSLMADADEWLPHTRGPMVPLADLETTRGFFGGSPQQVMLAYQTAGAEVSRWLGVVGRAGVPLLASNVAGGEGFAETYQQLERAARQQKRRLTPATR